MEIQDLESMRVDELWSLHQLVTSVLAEKISAEKARLDQQLRQLDPPALPRRAREHARRPYPQVFPKYRNPTQPAETWAGRGKKPRWLTAQLSAGRMLEDFRIKPSHDRGLRVV